MENGYTLSPPEVLMVVSIGSQASWRQILKFVEWKRGRINVWNFIVGYVIGIFSERDVVHGLSADRERLLSMEVGEVMTAGVESCGPEDDINDVITMMAKRHFRHVPVIEDSKIKGIISLRDLIEYRILKIAE